MNIFFHDERASIFLSTYLWVEHHTRNYFNLVNSTRRLRRCKRSSLAFTFTISKRFTRFYALFTWYSPENIKKEIIYFTAQRVGILNYSRREYVAVKGFNIWESELLASLLQSYIVVVDLTNSLIRNFKNKRHQMSSTFNDYRGETCWKIPLRMEFILKRIWYVINEWYTSKTCTVNSSMSLNIKKKNLILFSPKKKHFSFKKNLMVFISD